jgi:excisionase family DNA binding protein
VIEPLVTAAELAEILGFSAATIVDWAERDELPCFKIGGRLRFRESEVEAWLEQRRGRGARGDVSPAPSAVPAKGVVSHLSPAPVGGDDDG